MSLAALMLIFAFAALVVYTAIGYAAVGGKQRAYRIFEFFEAVVTGIDVAFRRRSSAWFDLQSADEEDKEGKRVAFSTSRGDLVTLIRVRGVSSVQDRDEIAARIDTLSTKLASFFNRGGHAIQIRMFYDPERGIETAEEAMQANRNAAKRLKLDIEFMLDDWVQSLGRYLAKQDILMAVWTTPNALQSAQERRLATGERAQAIKASMNAPHAANIHAGIPALRQQHRAFADAVCSALDSAGIISDILEVHEAAREMRACVAPDATPAQWVPRVAGDPIALRANMRSDRSNIMYPSLVEQIMVAPMAKEGQFLRVGEKLYAFVYMTLWPQQPKVFNALMDDLVRNRVPFIVSTNLAGNALAGSGINSALATLFRMASDNNKMLVSGLREVQQRMLNGECFVGAQMVFATWIGADEKLSLLRTRQAAIAGAVAQWGSCDVSAIVGDPALAFTACMPGVTMKSPAPRTPAPLGEVIPMLPLDRPAAIWKDGAVLYRAGTQLFPFQQGSSLQAAPVEVGFAPMGSGKSVNLGVTNLGFILQADELPYLSMSDIGPSSRGLVETIRMALPRHLRHMAQYHRLRYEKRYTVNVLDLPLGGYTPLPLHEKFLVNFMCLLAGDASGKTDEAIPGLATACVKAVYEERMPQANYRRYSRGVDADVDAAIAALSIEIQPHTGWYDLRDALFDKQMYHEAMLAQRYAVPTLSELASKAQDAKITSSYNKVVDGESITYYFFRKITEAIQRVPILDGASKFSLDDARIISLDLDEVAPNTGGEASGWLAAVAVMLSRHLLAGRFFVQPEDAALFPQKYQPYQTARIRQMRESPKRIAYDELQRFSKNKFVVEQFAADAGTMVREGRKWNLHLAFYSQSVTHIPDDIVNLSFTRYVFGGSKEEIALAGSKLHLNEAARKACMRIGKPGKHGANFVAAYRVAGVKGDEAVQALTSTIGSSLLWALETVPQNASVRNRLYELWGVRKTLMTLGKHYPGGVVDEIKGLQQEMSEDDDQGAIAVFVERLIERFGNT